MLLFRGIYGGKKWNAPAIYQFQKVSLNEYSNYTVLATVSYPAVIFLSALTRFLFSVWSLLFTPAAANSVE